METRHCQVNRQADARLASPIHHVQSDCITAYVCVCVCVNVEDTFLEGVVAACLVPKL